MVQQPSLPSGQFKMCQGLSSYVTQKPAKSERMDPTSEVVVSAESVIVISNTAGFSPKLMYGADILANKTKCLAIVPDFNRVELDTTGEIEIMKAIPPDPEEQMKDLDKILGAMRNKGLKKLGVVIFCWESNTDTSASMTGASATTAVPSSLAAPATSASRSAASPPAWAFSNFADAIASVRPPIISADHAKGFQAPIALFISKDQSQAEADKFMKALSSKPFASQNICKPCLPFDEETNEQSEAMYHQMAAFFQNAFRI